MSKFDLIAMAEADASAALVERQKRILALADAGGPFATYIAGPELRAAANVALSLGRPLLLTGEPGSGKTSAAAWLGKTFALPPTHVHEFQVRSDSRARDLRYDFDAVSWFRASELARGRRSTGLPKGRFIHPRALGLAFGWKGPSTQPHLVLIDEIDKAPRDFPNDLLLELDKMKFTVEETLRQVGPPNHRPIIVITSNAERRLPDPFLRRCIVHEIALTPETILGILQVHLALYKAGEPEFLKAATSFWTALRKTELSRKPTIAEYWQWIALVVQHGNVTVPQFSALLQDSSARSALPLIQALLGPDDLRKMADTGRQL